MTDLPKMCPFCGKDGETVQTTCMEWEVYKVRKGVDIREDIYQKGVKRGEKMRRCDGE